MDKTALVLIATGEKYWHFIQPLLESAKRFFVPHEVVLFTDSQKRFDLDSDRRLHQIKYTAEGFPTATLMRYRTFLTQTALLTGYDYVFYCDIDMLFVDTVEDIFADGITATQHPGFITQRPELESNTLSSAYVERVDKYYCGGFNGGTSKAFLQMAEEINKNIALDLDRGIIARWHDESHLNKYLYRHSPAKVLSPSYCYPETNIEYYKTLWNGQDYKPILVALDKNKDRQQTQEPTPSGLKAMSSLDRKMRILDRMKII